ncbi:MAG: class I SAM-dependent methyltransferase [Spirochaetes bacterium]|jgi:SAM-dependent methyltransferase|nr:class I SAM-dependent methyltransferase [Spirochaetota bacterium]
MKLYNDLAEYYFSIENNHRNINDDISFILKIIPSIKDSKLLDIGCGTGEHLKVLSGKGLTCIGIDSSPEMLRIAKMRNPDKKISFIRMDMASFDFYEEFDVALSIFGTFNYVLEDSDVDRVFWNTWRALKSNGTAVFEIWNSIPIEIIHKKDLSHISTTAYEDVKIDRERGFRILEYPNKTVVEVNYNYLIKTGSGQKTVRDRHVMRTFTYDEIKKFIEGNSFRIINVFSSFKNDPYTEKSTRMVIHFSKT